jgi:hypothetical protein
MTSLTDQNQVQESDGFRRYALKYEDSQPPVFIEFSETLSVKEIEKIFRVFVKLLRREGFGPTPLM